MDEYIKIAHGSGGLLANKLIDEVIAPGLGYKNRTGGLIADSALLPAIKNKLLFTTDSFVVTPRKFKGGDIGKLSVCGTVNDLLAAGAKPLYLSLALIIEAGFKIDELAEYLDSIRKTAKKAGVKVVCGDTKVVEKGNIDGLFINTAGIGECLFKAPPNPFLLKNDQQYSIILTGEIAEHGLAIMAYREKFAMKIAVKSDSAELTGVLLPVFKKYGDKILCMRDPTRGGLAATLYEIAVASSKSILIDETTIPIKSSVKGGCELLGLDPYLLANEGKMVLFTERKAAYKVVELLKQHPLGKKAAIIGNTQQKGLRPVFLQCSSGFTRPLEIPTGLQLPRIC